MTDLDERLGSALERLTEIRMPNGDVDALASVQARVRRRHRARVAVAFAVPLLVVGLAAWAAWPSDESATPVVTDPDPAPTTTAPTNDTASGLALPGVTNLDPGPLSPRTSTAVVDLGNQRILVWGGRTDTQFGFDSDVAFADGAIYDRSTDEWAPIARAPAASLTSHSVAITTDDEVVAFGGSLAMAWEPGSDSWRTIADLPGPVTDAVWTGDEILATAHTLGADPVQSWISIDTQTGEVTTLPDQPTPIDGTAVWTGDELVVLGKPDRATFPTPIEGNAYNPATNTWRRIPQGPLVIQAITEAFDGEGVVVADYSGMVVRYEPDEDDWTWLPPLPGSGSEASAEVFAGDGQVVVAFGGSMNIAHPDLGWYPLAVDGLTPRPFGRSILLSSGELVTFGHLDGSDRPANGFEVIDLDEALGSNTVYLGARIDLPGVADLLEVESTDPGGASPLTRAEIVLGPDTCTVTVRYGENIVDGGAGTVTITPAGGEPTWEAQRLDGSAGTAIGRGSHRIDCGSLEQSIELASYYRPPDHWSDS